VAGVFVLEPEIFGRVPVMGSHDLVHHLLTPAVESGCRVLAYRTTEYLEDCGTPDRYARVLNDFQSGRVHAQYRMTPRPALFIDRDGTVNRHVGYVTKPEQLELLPGTGVAIRRLNQAGVLAILVTNQPVVARGDCSAAELDRIHARLETLLGIEGAFLDGIYACPHHPDGGFPGEVAELKIACHCRKPQPGLVHQAARELPVDLGRSAVVGDSECDVALARRLGLTAYRISSDIPSEPGVMTVLDLAEAVGRWLEDGGTVLHAPRQ
jgi:histidinol-phosphate phosphatase family protein